MIFSLVSKAVMRHMLRNSYFDKRLQKEFLPDVAGCLEHSSLLSDTLRDARAHQRSICISGLDLKNVLGSVRHSVIIFAFQYYGFPEHFIQLVRSYYDHLSVVVAVPGILSTSAIHLALGVFQGCTLSPTLFNISGQLALDSIEMKHCGYQFSSDPETVLRSSACADDIQLVTSLAEQNQCLLNNFDSFLLWSRTMSARPNKCWSAALKKHASGRTIGLIHVSRYPTKPCNTLTAATSDTLVGQQMSSVQSPAVAQTLKHNFCNGWKRSMT